MELQVWEDPALLAKGSPIWESWYGLVGPAEWLPAVSWSTKLELRAGQSQGL